MRIIAGEWRGRTLRAPKGELTRPTTDRVRESLMSSLSSARGGFEGAVVLDAFAGSGALALEALSRGAASAVLVECDREAQRAVEANIAACGCASRARLVRGDVIARPPMRSADGPYDLVFLDPPYVLEPDVVCGLLARWHEAGILASGALVCYEHVQSAAREVDGALEALGWEVRARRKYGKTGVAIVCAP